MELSYYQGLSAQPLMYVTYWDLLDRRCDETQDKDASVIYEDDVCTYRATFKELRETTWINASIFMMKYPDLKVGDRIAIIGGTSPEVTLTQLMALRLGMSFLLPPNSMKDKSDTIAALQMTNCRVLVFDTKCITNEEIDTIMEVVPSLKFCITFGKNMKRYDSDRVLSWESFFDPERYNQLRRDNSEIHFNELQPEAEAFALFTSGTTGRAKAVIYTHFTIVNANVATPIYKSSTKFLHDRPFTTAQGVAFSLLVLSQGGTVYTLNSTQLVVNPALVYDIIEREKITMMLMFGYMMYDFITSPAELTKDLSLLTKVIFSGQVINQEHENMFQKLLPTVQIINLYGSSEMGEIAVSEPTSTPGFTGKITPHTEVKIIDETGKTVECGIIGELCARTPILFLQYITVDGPKPGKDDFGWFHSDDSAIMNNKGEIKILGRMSDVIKRRSVLIFPAVIEKTIAEHSSVEEVVVVGVSDERLYQDLCACIILSASATTLTEEELRKWCGSKFQVDKTGRSLEPAYYVFLEEIPRTAVAKVDRKKLAVIAEEMVHA